jgi:hypothetical protein
MSRSSRNSLSLPILSVVIEVTIRPVKFAVTGDKSKGLNIQIGWP